MPGQRPLAQGESVKAESPRQRGHIVVLLSVISVSLTTLVCLVTMARAQTPSDYDQGIAAFERGAVETAIESWARAARAAEKAGDSAAQVSALVRLADAYAALGQYRQAVVVLDGALKVAEKSGDRSRVAWILA